MDIVGPVWVKINGKYKITVTNFSASKAQNTKVHVGGFGVFGTSQSAGKMVTGSFKISIPSTGLEFDPDVEFATPGGQMTCESPGGGYRRGFTFVHVNKDDFVNDQAAGTAEKTINWTAEEEVPM